MKLSAKPTSDLTDIDDGEPKSDQTFGSGPGVIQLIDHPDVFHQTEISFAGGDSFLVEDGHLDRHISEAVFLIVALFEELQVGRHAVTDVEPDLFQNFGFYESGLMTEKHAVFAGRTALGLFAKLGAVREQLVNVSIDDVKISGLDEFFDLSQYGGVCKCIAAVHEVDPLSFGHSDAAVHGIIDPPVGFADEFRDGTSVMVDDLQGAVGGTSVHDDILYIGTGLSQDALNGFLDGVGIVVNNGNDGE